MLFQKRQHRSTIASTRRTCATAASTTALGVLAAEVWASFGSASSLDLGSGQSVSASVSGQVCRQRDSDSGPHWVFAGTSSTPGVMNNSSRISSHAPGWPSGSAGGPISPATIEDCRLSNKSFTTTSPVVPSSRAWEAEFKSWAFLTSCTVPVRFDTKPINDRYCWRVSSTSSFICCTHPRVMSSSCRARSGTPSSTATSMSGSTFNT
mmetsp:Transcript_97897/g.261229  ORF Transcript_97897/g.261229 Transcript_97897/m.261229 type:complete len:208 (+) Transcript_97897:678-1301(+)